jgi:hypothetical protein
MATSYLSSATTVPPLACAVSLRVRLPASSLICIACSLSQKDTPIVLPLWRSVRAMNALNPSCWWRSGRTCSRAFRNAWSTWSGGDFERTHPREHGGAPSSRFSSLWVSTFCPKHDAPEYGLGASLFIGEDFREHLRLLKNSFTSSSGAHLAAESAVFVWAF